MYLPVPLHLLNRYELRQYRQRWRLTPKSRKSGQRHWTWWHRNVRSWARVACPRDLYCWQRALNQRGGDDRRPVKGFGRGRQRPYSSDKQLFLELVRVGEGKLCFSYLFSDLVVRKNRKIQSGARNVIPLRGNFGGTNYLLHRLYNIKLPLRRKKKDLIRKS